MQPIMVRWYHWGSHDELMALRRAVASIRIHLSGVTSFAMAAQHKQLGLFVVLWAPHCNLVKPHLPHETSQSYTISKMVLRTFHVGLAPLK